MAKLKKGLNRFDNSEFCQLEALTFFPYNFFVKSYLQAVGHTTGHSNLVFLHAVSLDLDTGDTMFNLLENAKYGLMYQKMYRPSRF